MSESAQTKVCPLCAEIINTAAKVCPHCRHWQNKWSVQNPMVWTTLFALLYFAILAVLVAFGGKMFRPNEQFASYRDEINVVSSQFSHRIFGSNVLITVVGMLTNRSNIGWKNVRVEAQFLDKSGKLIDAITANADDYHGVTILPHSLAAFKIEGKAARPESDYDTYKASVHWATDVDAWP